MSGWWPARRGVAAMAVLAGLATCVLALGPGAPPWFPHAAAGYLALVVLAVLIPWAIVLQAVGGQALAAVLLLGSTPMELSDVLPVVVGVLLTAELLGVTARLAGPVPREAGPHLLRAAAGALTGGAIFAAVLLLANAPGPRGLAAAGLAVAACLGVAWILVREVRAQ